MLKRFVFVLVLVCAAQGVALFAPSQSSSSGVAQELLADKFECLICKETYSLDKFLPCAACSHGFCYQCTVTMARYRISQCPMCRESMQNVEGVTSEGTSCRQGVAEQLIPTSAEHAVFLARLYDLGARLDESERLRREERVEDLRLCREENERHLRVRRDENKSHYQAMFKLEEDARRRLGERFRRSELEDEAIRVRRGVEHAAERAWIDLRHEFSVGASALRLKEQKLLLDINLENKREELETELVATQRQPEDETTLAKRQIEEARALSCKQRLEESSLQSVEHQEEMAIQLARSLSIKEEICRLAEEMTGDDCLAEKEELLREVAAIDEVAELLRTGSEFSATGNESIGCLRERIEACNLLVEKLRTKYEEARKARYLSKKADSLAKDSELLLREEEFKKDQQLLALQKEESKNEFLLLEEKFKKDQQQNVLLKEEWQREVQQKAFCDEEFKEEQHRWKEEHMAYTQKNQCRTAQINEDTIANEQRTAEIRRMIDEEEWRRREDDGGIGHFWVKLAGFVVAVPAVIMTVGKKVVGRNNSSRSVSPRLSNR